MYHIRMEVVLSHSINLIYNLIFVNLYMIVGMFSEIMDFFKKNWVYILIVSFFILVLNLNILIHDISFKNKPGKLNSIFVIENMEDSPLKDIIQNEVGGGGGKSTHDKLVEQEKLEKKRKGKKEQGYSKNEKRYKR